MGGREESWFEKKRGFYENQRQKNKNKTNKTKKKKQRRKQRQRKTNINSNSKAGLLERCCHIHQVPEGQCGQLPETKHSPDCSECPDKQESKQEGRVQRASRQTYSGWRRRQDQPFLQREYNWRWSKKDNNFD